MVRGRLAIRNLRRNGSRGQEKIQKSHRNAISLLIEQVKERGLERGRMDYFSFDAEGMYAMEAKNRVAGFNKEALRS